MEVGEAVGRVNERYLMAVGRAASGRLLRQRLACAAHAAAVGNLGRRRLSGDSAGADCRRDDCGLDHDGSRAWRPIETCDRQLARLHCRPPKYDPALPGADAAGPAEGKTELPKPAYSLDVDGVTVAAPGEPAAIVAGVHFRLSGRRGARRNRAERPARLRWCAALVGVWPRPRGPCASMAPRSTNGR